MLRLRETEGQASNYFPPIQAPRSETLAFIQLGLLYLDVTLGLPPDFSGTGDVPNFEMASGILFGHFQAAEEEQERKRN
jgi:hypothetical protein